MEGISEYNWTRWTETEPVPAFPQFWFEKVDIPFWYDFAEKYMISLIILTLVVYYVAIWEMKQFMRARKPLDLRLPLFLWNCWLALYSAVQFWRLYSEMAYLLSKPDGFYRSMCIREGLHMSTVFWAVVGSWFRPFFILDTMFLILRKKPVGNFHVLHHTFSIILAPLLMVLSEPMARYFVIVHLFVHTVDYFLLALKSLKISVPKCNEIMNVLEVAQMAFMLAISKYTVYLKETRFCVRHPGSVMLTNFICTGLLIALPVSLLLTKIKNSTSKTGKLIGMSTKEQKSD